MNFYLILPIVQAILSLILLIIVSRAKSQDTSRYLFSTYLGGLLVWGTLIFLMRSSPNAETAYFWEKLLLPLGLFLTATMFHFSIAFGGFKLKKWVLVLIYAGCALVLGLSEAGWVVAGMQTKPYGYAPLPGPLFMVVALSSYTLAMISIINLWKYSRKAVFSAERTRSSYILIGMIISVLGGVFDVLPLLGLSLYPGVIFGNITFCLFTSIAILKYNLLGVRIIVRKGITYFLASAVAATPYLIALLVFRNISQTDVPTWGLVLLFILLAFILQPLWRVIQSLIDKLFYMSRYDFLRALDDFSQKTHRINDINTLGNSLVKLVARALQASNVYLFLPSSKGDFNLISTSKENKENVSAFSFSSHNPVLSWLRSRKMVLRREEMTYFSKLQSLTTEDMDRIDSIQAELFIPVLDKEDDLVGVMVLGPKMNHQPYSEEDEQLILTVTDRLALELENARLYSLELMAHKELQKQNDMKTEFLHSAAHELKTPLTAIISSSEMLMEKLSENNEELDQRLARNIYDSSLAMNRRVSELLDFARVQIGSLEMEKQLLDINEVAKEVVSRLTPLFDGRKQRLDLEIQPVATVNADKDKIEQVFINLLSNANKYSPNNSDIIVRTRQNNGTVQVEVEDSAPIISEGDKSKMFTPYYRGEDIKLRQRIPGLGLGLVITKKIIEMHGGKIWVDCKPGKGNIFAFSLAVSP